MINPLLVSHIFILVCRHGILCYIAAAQDSGRYTVWHHVCSPYCNLFALHLHKHSVLNEKALIIFCSQLHIKRLGMQSTPPSF